MTVSNRCLRKPSLASQRFPFILKVPPIVRWWEEDFYATYEKKEKNHFEIFVFSETQIGFFCIWIYLFYIIKSSLYEMLSFLIRRYCLLFIWNTAFLNKYKILTFIKSSELWLLKPNNKKLGGTYKSLSQQQHDNTNPTV